ncbi:hypothetical protein HNP12_004567 [Aeromonas hydrophila]|uniref:DUF4231 domain-containing protein n=1 Tax=Aeromonas hydrophila TaxID=644 RepID=UPI0021678194|nr:DUF4231 domain-containing protein [Aeromonas hydrophila]MCS3770426.1 hypothetical protein [Aeromonas hydrophila]
MKETDFPGLYQSADDLSGGAQSSFFAALALNLIFLVSAAVVSVVNYPHWGAALIQALLLAGATASSVYLALVRPERLWYSGRAVAESIKTLTWRYVSRAEPFHEDDLTSKKLFLIKLKEVISQNQGISDKLTSHISEKQISSTMVQLRADSFDTRRDNYIKHRINDQLMWYEKKAKSNKKSSERLFAALIFINALALIFALVKIANVQYPYFPTDILIAFAASLLTWMQAKRFSELSASYALTAHEIGIIREQADELISDNGLSLFVGDAENAFSREHTQWVARKDS